MQIKNYVAAFNSWKNQRDKMKSTAIHPPVPPISVAGLSFATSTITTSGPICLSDFVYGSRGSVVNYSATMCVDPECNETFTGSMKHWEN